MPIEFERLYIAGITFNFIHLANDVSVQIWTLGTAVSRLLNTIPALRSGNIFMALIGLVIDAKYPDIVLPKQHKHIRKLYGPIMLKPVWHYNEFAAASGLSKVSGQEETLCDRLVNYVKVLYDSVQMPRLESCEQTYYPNKCEKAILCNLEKAMDLRLNNPGSMQEMWESLHDA